jgi:hypothetical protein
VNVIGYQRAEWNGSKDSNSVTTGHVVSPRRQLVRNSAVERAAKGYTLAHRVKSCQQDNDEVAYRASTPPKISARLAQPATQAGAERVARDLHHEI